jgi:hypothetical protein
VVDRVILRVSTHNQERSQVEIVLFGQYLGNLVGWARHYRTVSPREKGWLSREATDERPRPESMTQPSRAHE